MAELTSSLKFTACAICGAFVKVMVDGEAPPELDNVERHLEWHGRLRDALIGASSPFGPFMAVGREAI